MTSPSPGARRAHIQTRRLDWPECQNTRDLGGLPRPGGVTRSGVIVRSDSVAHLTEEGRAAMTAYGVTTVIDLRSPSELLTAPNPFADGAGPAYVNRPLVDDSTMVRLGEASDMYGRYLMMLEHRQEAFRDILNAVAEADGAVLFHCFAGKDRTGLVAALMLAVAGVTDDAIAADFGETDAQLAARYQEWLAAAPPERRRPMAEELQCPPERILGVLDHIKQRWGGVEAYLEGAGMTQPNIDRLKSKLA